MTTTAPRGAALTDTAPVTASAAVQPIVAGFHPDPTICRVGVDYYLAHSSFEYAPGIPIWHSTDLLTWTQLGNALDRDEQFAGGHAGASQGVFAPTLRHHDGRFLLIVTDVSGAGGQIVVTADDPAGPWSAPIRLRELEGIDPDLAWDSDGTCYVTYCSTAANAPGIAQARVDLQHGRVLEEPRPLWSGTGLAFPEAPHLYEHDGWWYLLVAEGGTERGHSASIARSRRPGGPFVGAPSNPVLTHRSTTHPVQNTGHADLVQAADGSWAMVYLGVRPRGVTPMYHVNGRETFLAGVDWADGWPIVRTARFDLPAPAHGFADRFESDDLHPRWVSPGAAPRAQIVTRDDDGIVLRSLPASGGGGAAIVTRVRDQSWSFEADIDATDGHGSLVVRLDDRHRYELHADGDHVRVEATIGGLSFTGWPEVPVAGRSTIRVESVDSCTGGPDDLRLGVVADEELLEIARLDGRYLSTEVAGGFTGRVVGVRARSDGFRVRSVRYRAEPGGAR